MNRVSPSPAVRGLVEPARVAGDGGVHHRCCRSALTAVSGLSVRFPMTVICTSPAINMSLREVLGRFATSAVTPCTVVARCPIGCRCSWRLSLRARSGFSLPVGAIGEHVSRAMFWRHRFPDDPGSTQVRVPAVMMQHEPLWDGFDKHLPCHAVSLWQLTLHTVVAALVRVPGATPRSS